MALKNLFDMVKADKYTADGREALIKAQEAETEDQVYNIGDISRKTGLMKTANGWVKPKSGAGRNHGTEQKKRGPGAIHTPGKGSVGMDKMKEAAEKGLKGQELKEFMTGSKKPAESKPDAADQRDQIGGEIKGNLEAAKYYFDKAQSFSPTDPSYKTYMTKAKQYNDEAKAQADDNGFDFEEMHNSGITQAVNKYAEEQSKPAAQEVKLGGGADTYYFEDPDNMSNEDKVFKSLGIELAETFGDHDGEPGNTETWANGWLDNIMDNGGLGIKSKKTRQPAAPVPAEEVMRIVEENPARWNRIIGNAKKFYEGKGRSTDFESDEFYPIKLVGGKTKPSAQYYAEGKRNEKNNPLTGKYVTQRQNTSKDAAPSLSEIVDRVYNIGEISEKTGLQKTANGWVKPKKGAAGAKTGEGKSPSAGSINRTPERIKKETAIMEALNLSTGEDNNLHKMSDETIERLYKKAMSDTPAPKKENQTRTFTFNAGPDGKPVPGTGKQVQTFKTKEEAQKALNTQNAAAKYKNLPGPQRKDALFASTFEGISIGQTQNQMERQGWDLIKADDQVNVYGKPDGSKVTMKHDGKNITETNYEAPAAGSESKPEGRNFRSELEANPKGAYDFEKTIEHSIPMTAGDKEILGRVKSFMQEEGTDYKNALKSVATGLVNGNKLRGNWYPEKEKSLLKIAKAVGMDEEVKSYVKTMAKGYDFGYSEDSAPRVLTGDCRIRIRKEKPALTGDTKIRVRK